MYNNKGELCAVLLTGSKGESVVCFLVLVASQTRLPFALQPELLVLDADLTAIKAVIVFLLIRMLMSPTAVISAFASYFRGYSSSEMMPA